MTRGERTTTVIVNAMLCDAAFMLGDHIAVQGGVKAAFSATGTPPKVSRIGVAVHLEMPPGAVGMRHTLQLSLEDSAGVPVALSNPAAGHAHTRYVLEAEVNVYGSVPAGQDTLRVPWCTNLQNLTVPDPGSYQLVLSVDNVDARRLDFDVHTGS